MVVPSEVKIKLRFPEVQVNNILINVKETPHLDVELAKEESDGSISLKRTVYSKELEEV